MAVMPRRHGVLLPSPAMSGAAFPIDPLLPAIRDSLARHPRLVLEAPPGAGKTTRVPPALLDCDWLGGRRIVMLEPRRVAARAAAHFMARQFGEEPGGVVGYRIRFDNRTSARTRIEVVTEGVLTRMLQDDPLLDGFGALLFDEFHERHLSGDLGLALALDVQAQLRDDLRLVLMSATLDGAALAAFLDAPRLSSAGRSHPVAIGHFPARRDEPLAVQVKRCVATALAEHPGDVLVFLPGVREISQAMRLLAEPGAVGDAEVLPLHGELPLEQQTAALAADPRGRRRVVLSTNVAESSVTLPGVRAVIDSGLAREPRFDPNSGFSRLVTVTVSQASADQRAGRAGRVAAGGCYRLWPESQRLERERRPEIMQVDLAGLALELAAWGSRDLRFLDPPPPGTLAAADELLARLGALLDGTITPLGRRLLALGTHPRLGAMLCAARADDQAPACDLAALVEARDPLRGGPGTAARDDLVARWQALAAFRRNRLPGGASRAALFAIDQAAGQWRRRLGLRGAAPPAEVPAHCLGDLLLHAFPERIARQHPTDARRYLLASGRSARLDEGSAWLGEPWLVAVELRHGSGDGVILRAAPLDPALLEREFPERFTEHERVFWDADLRRIVAVRERRFDRIVLDTRPLPNVDRSRFAEALTGAVRESGIDALPWTEPLQQWRARVALLRELFPELGLPAVDDEGLLASLERWLTPALAGKTRLDALDGREFGDALRSLLDWSQRQALERLAPVDIEVPSGQHRRIAYAAGELPVLAVKLQELFGLADTPRIADGRVTLTLHLLSPGGRPLQVTQDLRSFWERTYPEVRKEMKGRYPRHPWPDDPWSAPPTHRAKPRGR
jgi:ATP-dependent helicase HrpB